METIRTLGLLLNLHNIRRYRKYIHGLHPSLDWHAIVQVAHRVADD